MAERTHDRAVSELTESIARLIRRIRTAGDDHDLPLTESSVLKRLSRDGAATTADLARAESMTPQSMGAIIARLEQQRLVRRKPHPTDGRQLLLELTPRGAALRKRVRDSKESWIAQAVAQLTPQEQKTLFAAGEIMRRMLEQEAPQ